MMVLFLFFNIDGFQVLIDAAATFTIHIHTPMNDWNSIPNVSLYFLYISSRMASTFWYVDSKMQGPLYCKYVVRLHFRNAACNVLVSELDYNF